MSFVDTSDKPVVLVTGGAGYVGSHVCLALASAGFLPVVYDNLQRGFESLVQFGPFEPGDLNDKTRLAEIIAKWQPEITVHMAGLAYVGESVAQPDLYWHNNIVGSLSLLEALHAAHLRTGKRPPYLVFSSSCAVYGITQHSQLDETHPTRPISPYAQSKLMVEQMLTSYEKAYGVRSVCLRYFNAAGADPQTRIGECHDPETHVIPLLLDTAMGRIPYFSLYGEDFDTPDGSCIRDYVHVLDLATAHVNAVQRLIGGGTSITVNLGTENGFSVRELIAAAEKKTKCIIPVRLAPHRAGDPPRLIANANLARRELDWFPQNSSLDQLLGDAWLWHQKLYRNFNPSH